MSLCRSCTQKCITWAKMGLWIKCYMQQKEYWLTKRYGMQIRKFLYTRKINDAIFVEIFAYLKVMDLIFILKQFIYSTHAARNLYLSWSSWPRNEEGLLRGRRRILRRHTRSLKVFRLRAISILIRPSFASSKKSSCSVPPVANICDSQKPVLLYS